MKKIFFMLLAVATMWPSEAVAAVPANNSDSLAYYIGRTQGAGISRSSSAASLAGYRDRFVEGWKTIIATDTADIAFLDGVSVAMGMLPELRRMAQAGFPVNKELFAEQFVAAFLNPDKAGVTQADYDEFAKLMAPVQQRFQELQKQRELEKMTQEEKASMANFEAAAHYLDSLKAANPAVVATESGLVYEVLKEGDGPAVSGDDDVVVNYTGRLADGTVFDRTSPGEPRTFRARSLIRGFSEGLTHMKKGAYYRFYIPPQLGYGPKALGSIPSNSLLIFDVDLVDVKKNK